MSKKFIRFAFALVAIVGVTAVSSCKKGENDPVLSLKSRKARISGVWKLVEGTSTNSYGFVGALSSSTTTYTETTCSSNNNTYSYSETLTIEKDGTYKVEVVDDGDSYLISGVWFFAGKNKDLDLKKKEAIVLTPQEYSEQGYIETYTGLYGGEAIMIDMLKNKEMIFKGESSYVGDSGYTSNSTYDRTFEKK